MNGLPIIIGLGVLLLVLVIAFRSQGRVKAAPKNNWTNERHLKSSSGVAPPGEFSATQDGGASAYGDAGGGGDGGGGGD